VARAIHAKITPRGLVYRLWDTVADRYVTSDTTKARAAEILKDYLLKSVNEQVRGELAQAALFPRAEWDTERCRGCELFHHAFVEHSHGVTCRDCGGDPNDKAHQPPCDGGDRGR
jgi:hypothetical protein